MKKKLKEKFGENVALSVKWSLVTAIFIFIIFSTFAYITFKVSTGLLVEQEKKNVETTLSEIKSRLRESDSDLSIRSTTILLKDSNPNMLENKSPDTIESNLIKMNTFISVLSQPELNVSIFNSSEVLVFETKATSLSYNGVNKRTIQIEDLRGKTGFMATEPVFSKETNKLIGYIQLFYELTSYYEIRSRLLKTLLVLEVVGIIISMLLGFVLSSYLMRPLKQMRDTVQEIKRDPQSEMRMPKLYTKDELAELSEVFNDMLDRMQKFIVQQQQFVEDVSHELRTPVAIIEGHLKLLSRWGKDDPVVLEESLDASLQEINRMKSLVQEMLDLSRVEQVEFQHNNEVSCAKEVIYQTFNNFKLLYPDFIFILDDDLTTEKSVQIYRNHFEQLLIILLDNAVKYSKERKEIHLSVSSTLEELEIAVQDFGEGIAPEDLDKIFHRFYRVDKARSRHKGGNGLGLSIAQELVESYKGRIYAESAVGQGSIFRIVLPIAPQEE